MLLSIVIPAYNEIEFIDEILRRVKETPYEKEIIVVDDCSTDGTREYLKNLNNGVITIFQELNQGKGAALQKGIAMATGDVVLIQDADLEYDPRDYSALLEPIVQGRCCLRVACSRHVKEDRLLRTFYRRLYRPVQ